MVNVANIICKTVGIAGMSAIVYDAYANGKHHSAVGKEELSNDVFEKTIATTRTNTDSSHISSAMQKKVSNLRMNNPIVPFFGSVKGFVGGFFDSLGDNIIPVTLSSVALAAKGGFQKAGAWGLGIYAVYRIAKESFGVGKTTPTDE